MMKRIDESPQEARQAEILPNKPILKVLLISTGVAAILLFLAATFLV